MSFTCACYRVVSELLRLSDPALTCYDSEKCCWRDQVRMLRISMLLLGPLCCPGVVLLNSAFQWCNSEAVTRQP